MADARLDKAFNPGSVVSVTGSTTAVAAANPNRQAIIITNNEATATDTVFLKLGAAAVLGEGIRLNGVGGNIYLTNWTGAINGIATTTPANVGVVEF